MGLWDGWSRVRFISFMVHGFFLRKAALENMSRKTLLLFYDLLPT
jgi:hypothetical protein